MRNISLEEMLAVREERACIQDRLLETEGKTILSFTMNIPGAVKNSEWIQKSFDYGKADLLAHMEYCGILIREACIRELDSGPEGYFVIDSMLSAELAKRNVVVFEEAHPIGRWFDIDIKRSNGQAVSRGEIGLAPRKCFLCDQDAKACGRSRKHSVEELYEVTDKSLRLFVENETCKHRKTA